MESNQVQFMNSMIQFVHYKCNNIKFKFSILTQIQNLLHKWAAFGHIRLLKHSQGLTDLNKETQTAEQ